MNRSVLVVDDSADIRLVVRSYLEDWCVDVFEATSGVDAFKAFVKTSFDLVFVDLVMPQMDGAELIAKFRKIEIESGRPASYIVVVSGSIDSKDWDKAKQAGMNAQLYKPIEIEELETIMVTVGAQRKANSK